MDSAKTMNADIDFDGWSENAENDVLEALVKDAKVKYVIQKEGVFVGKFPDGHIMKTPLTLTPETLQSLTEQENSDDSEIDQLLMLLNFIGRDDDVEYLKKIDLLSAMDYAVKYFKAFEKLTNLTLGEYLR